MGNNTDSITKEIKLQWQTSSTDLIDPTPNSNGTDAQRMQYGCSFG
jgi:hypothetical protein